MAKNEVIVKSPLAIIATFTTYMFSIFNEMMVALLFVMALDYFTGIIRAIITKSLNSTIGLNGILKKMLMIAVVGLSACVQFVLQQLGIEIEVGSLKLENVLVVSAICFFFVNESLSVLENSAQIGLPVPRFLYEALEKLREIGGKEQKLKKRRK